jgi:hypothetical protein
MLVKSKSIKTFYNYKCNAIKYISNNLEFWNANWKANFRKKNETDSLFNYKIVSYNLYKESNMLERFVFKIKEKLLASVSNGSDQIGTLAIRFRLDSNSIQWSKNYLAIQWLDFDELFLFCNSRRALSNKKKVHQNWTVRSWDNHK